MKNDGSIPSHDFYIKNIAHVLRCQIDQKLVAFNVTESQVRLWGIYKAGKISDMR